MAPPRRPGDPGARATPGWSGAACRATARSRRAWRRGSAWTTSVRHALAHAYERWDGKGHPAGLAGEEVPVAIRIVTVARDAELWARQAGWPAAAEVLARRRGHAYDPAVVDAVVADGERWLAELGDDPCAAVLDAEPAPVRVLERLDGALGAMADFADLSSPFLRGALERGGRARCRGRRRTPACPTPR